MNIETLKNKILRNQEWLLDISLQINQSIIKSESHSDILNWIKTILKEDREILQSFEIQTDMEICNAVLVLLGAESSFKEAVLRPLIYRIISFLSSTLDLGNRSQKNKTLEDIRLNFKPLIVLTKEYKATLEHVSIEKIAHSLLATGLKEHIAHFKETDIQIVLKCLKWDDDKKDQEEEMTQLLDFLYRRLLANKRKRGVISDSRHAWWALKDNLMLRDKEWILANIKELEAILQTLLENGIYFTQSQHAGRNILDTSNNFYERVWVLENAIDIFSILRSKKYPFSDEICRKVKAFIYSHIREHTKVDYTRSLRNVQCDLILLYDILDNFPVLYEQPHERAGISGNSKGTASSEDESITWKDVLTIVKK